MTPSRRYSKTKKALRDGEPPPSPKFSDDGLALRFVDQQHQYLRFESETGRWFYFNGQIWKPDQAFVVESIRRLCREVAREIGDEGKAQRLTSAAKIKAIETLARSDRRVLAHADTWDRDPWLLMTPAGALDLRTGTVDPSNTTAMMTRMCPVAPGGECHRWMQFLKDVTGDDTELQAFLQRVAGYSLTGLTDEQVLFFLLGPGANGKSIFTRALKAILGRYAITAPMDTFMASLGSRHPTELAMLESHRLVLAAEVEPGLYWAEARIKLITGGDDIAARFMRQDFSEFTPKCKLMFTGNELPNLLGVGEATRRRLIIIPFRHVVPEEQRDLHLFDKLSQELGGILQWAIEGCLAWQQKRLSPPSSVRLIGADYFAKQDTLQLFLADFCELGQGLKCGSSELYRAYEIWCRSLSESRLKLSQRRFIQQLEQRGYRRDRSASQRSILGVALKGKANPVGASHEFP